MWLKQRPYEVHYELADTKYENRISTSWTHCTRRELFRHSSLVISGPSAISPAVLVGCSSRFVLGEPRDWLHSQIHSWRDAGCISNSEGLAGLPVWCLVGSPVRSTARRCSRPPEDLPVLCGARARAAGALLSQWTHLFERSCQRGSGTTAGLDCSLDLANQHLPPRAHSKEPPPTVSLYQLFSFP